MIQNMIKGGTLVLGISFLAAGQSDKVPAGTEVAVRLNESIDGRYPSDSRIYTGVIDRDVRDRSGRVVFPRGSETELILREYSPTEVVLDIESIAVDGRRYVVSTTDESFRSKDAVGGNRRTGKYVG